ncbi:hypothetical protein FGB62_37g42 [Gracilaria domingensis]|nr:hypothetical protein FGB62_37g42 [Gracilaria domingensis]
MPTSRPPRSRLSKRASTRCCRRCATKSTHDRRTPKAARPQNAPGGHRTGRPVDAHAALITPHADGRRDSVRPSGVARHSAAVQPRRTAHLRGQTGGLPLAQARRRPSAAQRLRGAQARGGASPGQRSVHLRAREREAGLRGAARRVRVRVGGHHRRGRHRDGAGHAAHEARRGALCTVRDGARTRGARSAAHKLCGVHVHVERGRAHHVRGVHGSVAAAEHRGADDERRAVRDHAQCGGGTTRAQRILTAPLSEL